MYTYFVCHICLIYCILQNNNIINIFFNIYKKNILIIISNNYIGNYKLQIMNWFTPYISFLQKINRKVIF